MPRTYLSNGHLRGLASSDAGSVAVLPTRAGRIFFDAAMSSHLPRNLPEGEHGSTVIDIGHGVSIRAQGSLVLEDGAWKLEGHLSTSQYPSGRDLTGPQQARAYRILVDLITEWASTHAGDLAQAEDIARNNGARTLEEAIERHTAALKILRSELRRCESWRTYTQYPDLPTER